VLAWAWQTDRHVFSRALAIYHRALEQAVGVKVCPVPGVTIETGYQRLHSLNNCHRLAIGNASFTPTEVSNHENRSLSSSSRVRTGLA
jgi:hypothetical protein